MDISVVNSGGYYTCSMNNDSLISWVDSNLDIPVYLRLTKSTFIVDLEEDMNSSLISIMGAGYTAELDGFQLVLNTSGLQYSNS